MKIAIEGCAHGELDTIYEAVSVLEKENNIKVDLLIICGDFQAVRNPADLNCMAVPPKYQKLNTFYKYYSGEKVAPILTIFVGGNHEASNYLSELSYGGWVCPNIFYLGYANVINIGGVRIAGLSGIYKGHDYLKGHFECPPYDQSTKKSVYHVRNIDVFRLKQIQNPVDICISHDWPRGVYNYGNKNEILRWKPFFRDEMDNNKLGSQPAEELLQKLKPSYWFAAHLHCKFAALIPHEPEKTYTKFLALDKCLPRRKFLQVLEIGAESSSIHIEYDPEWLCILQSTDQLLNISRNTSYMPGLKEGEQSNYCATDDKLEHVSRLFSGNFKVPENFAATAASYKPKEQTGNKQSLKVYINPQTTAFCNILQIQDPFSLLVNKSLNKSLSISEFSDGSNATQSTFASFNSNEIELSDNDSDSESTTSKDKTSDMDVSSPGVFFIDKKGVSDQSQNSISSNMKKFLQSQYCSTPKTESKPASVPCFPEIKEINTNEVSESEVQPTKKLKRRNQLLYQSDEVS